VPEMATGTMLWPQHRISIWRAMYLPPFLLHIVDGWLHRRSHNFFTTF